MSDELLELLHTAPAPTMTVDASAAMATARRASGRRQLLLGSAAAAMIIAAGVAAAEWDPPTAAPEGPSSSRGADASVPLNLPAEGFLVLSWGGQQHGFQVSAAAVDARGSVQFAAADPDRPAKYVGVGRIPGAGAEGAGSYLVDPNGDRLVVYLLTPSPVTRVIVDAQHVQDIENVELATARVPTLSTYGTVVHVGALAAAGYVRAVTWVDTGGATHRAIPSSSAAVGPQATATP